MEGITQAQADVIGEVANICIGNAATTLSLMLNRATNITAPVVEILSDETSLSNPDCVIVKVPYTKGLDGTNLMVLREHDAQVIVNLMMGGDGTDVSQITMDEMALSAISEAMNQMCGTIATSMSSLLDKPTDIGFPLVNSRYHTTFEIPDELCNGTDIVKVVFQLTVEGLVDSELIQLFPLSIVKQIIKQEEI